MASVGNTPAARKGEIYGKYKVLMHAMYDKSDVHVLNLETKEKEVMKVRDLKRSKR